MSWFSNAWSAVKGAAGNFIHSPVTLFNPSASLGYNSLNAGAGAVGLPSLGKLAGNLDSAGTTSYRADETMGGQPNYTSFSGSFANPGMNYYGSPSSNFWAPGEQSSFYAPGRTSDFWANPTYNGYNASNLRSEFNPINPYNVDFHAQQANLDESNYSPAIQSAMRQLAPGAGVAQTSIAGLGGLADTLRSQMTGQGPSLAQLQLNNATQQNNAMAMGAAQSLGGINPALASRMALNQGAQQNMAAGNASAQIRSQEQFNAENMLGNVLNSQGNLQIGQQNASTNLLSAGAQAQNVQNANRISNVMQAQQMNENVAFKNADMWQAAQNLNEQLAGRNLTAAMQAQNINADVSSQNANIGMQAQQMNQQTSIANAGFLTQADQMNAQTGIANAGFRTQADQMNASTSMGNAQLQGQTNQTNAGLYENYLGNWTNNNQINSSLYNTYLGNQTQRMATDAELAWRNAGQYAKNEAGMVGAGSSILGKILGGGLLYRGGEVQGYADGGEVAGLVPGATTPHAIPWTINGQSPFGGSNLLAYGHPSNIDYGTNIQGRQPASQQTVNVGGGQPSGAMQPNANAYANANDNAAFLRQTAPQNFGGQGGAYNPMMPHAYGFMGGGSTQNLYAFGDHGVAFQDPNARGMRPGMPGMMPAAGMGGLPPWFNPAMFQGGQQAQLPWMNPQQQMPQQSQGQLPWMAPQQQMPGLAATMGGFNQGGGVCEKPMYEGGFGGRSFEAGGNSGDTPGVLDGLSKAISEGRFDGGGGSIDNGVSYGMPGLPGAGPAQMTMPRMPGDYSGLFPVPYDQGGIADARPGGQVPGQPRFPGSDRPENDTVHAKLTPKEIVLPLSVTQAPDAPARAAQFVSQIQSKGQKPSGYGAVLAARARR